MLFFGKAHAATTNLPVTEQMSLWDRIQPLVDISANGHLITELFSYTTYMVIFFFVLVCFVLFGFSYFILQKETKTTLYIWK